MLATNHIQVVIFLFEFGLGFGCDYPTAHMIISENIPSLKRGKLVLGAFAFQAVGALAGTAVGFLSSGPSRTQRLALDVRKRDHSSRPRNTRTLQRCGR